MQTAKTAQEQEEPEQEPQSQICATPTHSLTAAVSPPFSLPPFALPQMWQQRCRYPFLLPVSVARFCCPFLLPVSGAVVCLSNL